ncbi:MAG: gliding motility-associated C-terminal domain-containing protein [Crocinitomicaceae bacterium]
MHSSQISSLRRAFRLMMFVVLFTQLSSTSIAQGTIPSIGVDFWYGYMHNSGSTNQELRLFISSQVATSGTVDIPLQAWSTNFTVAPNQTTTVIIPNNVGETIGSDLIESKGIHVTTADSVSLFAINFATFSADASKILPKQSLGIDYLVTAYNGLGVQSRSELLIVATEDNTQIEITPSVLTQGMNAAGVPYIINIDAGETYQLRALSSIEDLTGTRIKSTPLSGDCRPFAVFAGAECTNVPVGCSTCDHLYDQLFPVETWGTEYYVAPYETTGVFSYRVIARDNGTLVSINGAAPTPMTSGQVIEFNNVATDVQVVGNNPIQVVQYMQGDACSLNGDPAMLVLNANDQKIDNVTFSTVSSAVITNHFLNIIVETADIGNVLLDNTIIPASSFSTFSTNPLNSYAQLPLSQGSHSLASNNGVTGYVYGMGTAESYSYSVGSFKAEPQFQVDTTICTADSVVLSTPITLFNAEWVAQSDTTVILGTGNNLVMYPPIPTDIYSVTGNSLVSGCPVTYNYSVSAPLPPVISLTASEDTVCMFNDVQMGVNVLTPGTWEYQWSPAYMFDDPFSPNPILTVQQTGWYSVSVTNVGTVCSIAQDSVFITVQGGAVESVNVSASSNALCLPDDATLTGEVNQLLVNEDFNGGLNTSVWSSVLGETISSTCGSVSGDALFFNGGGVRSAATVDFNVANGGSLSFYIKVATGTAPCDDAEIGEDVYLEYSTNGGFTWVPMATLLESNYPVFTYLTLPIPAGAQTASTRFRWSQPNFTGPNQDVWMLENVNLSSSNTNGITFNWTPTAGLSNASSLNPTASPSTPTWFVLEVGQGQCTYADSVFIDVNPSFTLTTSNDTTVCSGDWLTVSTVPSVGTGYSYLWEPATAVISSSNTFFAATLASNTDTTMYVTVTSPLGCTQVDSVQISSINMDFGIVGDSILCLPDTDTLSVQVFNTNVSSYSVEWLEAGSVIGTTDSILVSPIVTTQYIAELTDAASQCQWLDTFEIEVRSFTVDAGPDTTLCSTVGYQMQGSSTTPAVMPEILWDNITTLSAVNVYDAIVAVDVTAQYVLSVSDGFCEYSDTMDLTFSPPVEVYIPDDTTICEGTSFTLDFTGATGVIWNTTVGITNPQSTQPVFSPTTTQTYIIDYLTVNGCPFTDTIVVNVDPLPVISLPPDITICEEDIEIINPTINVPGGNYLWNTGETTSTIQALTDGIYWVTYSNACGSSTDSMEITYHPDFSVDLGNDTLMCSGYTLDLNPVLPVGSTVFWSTGAMSTSLTVTSPSITSIEVFDVNGCVRRDTIELSALPPIQIDLGPDFSMCEYDISTLDGTSPQGVTYLWSTGDTTSTISVADAGTYFVQVTDALGCLNWDTIVVTETPTPDPVILGPTTFCSNETVQFEATSGYVGYQWNTGDNSNPIQFQGFINEISVLVTDGFGCVGGDTIAVSVIDVPILDLGDDIVLCEPGITILNAEVPGASGYTWTPNNETTATIDAPPGTYSVVVNYDICTITDEISITVEPYELDLGDDKVACFDEGVFVAHSMENIDSIIWHDGSSSSWFEQLSYPSLTDTFTISATSYGCDVKYDTVLVFIEDCNCLFYVPNSFTPNGDQINEGFNVYHDCPVIEFEFSIFNRWGELIFESRDPNFIWDGTIKSGEKVQDGVYAWRMRYMNEYTNFRKVKEVTGHVNVLR